MTAVLGVTVSGDTGGLCWTDDWVPPHCGQCCGGRVWAVSGGLCCHAGRMSVILGTPREGGQPGLPGISRRAWCVGGGGPP